MIRLNLAFCSSMFGLKHLKKFDEFLYTRFFIRGLRTLMNKNRDWISVQNIKRDNTKKANFAEINIYINNTVYNVMF